MLDLQELLNLPKLGLDDTFTFGCSRCNRCCREREDILLTPLDVFKIAKHLGQQIGDIIKEYCECYEGETSKTPVVRIKPREYRKTCPFSSKDGCRIHPVKPAVCALFPIGRMTDAQTGEFSYFQMPATCGNKNQSQTIRRWLSEFSLIEEENIAILWHQKLGEVSLILNETCEKINYNHADMNAVLFLTLYVFYDLEQDFMPQFERNCEKALQIVKTISSADSDVDKDLRCTLCGESIASGSVSFSTDNGETAIHCECLEEHCVSTNCYICKIGKYPDCEFQDMKRALMSAKKSEEGDDYG